MRSLNGNSGRNVFDASTMLLAAAIGVNETRNLAHYWDGDGKVRKRREEEMTFPFVAWR